MEDNQDTLRFLALVLGRRGHEVREAANLAEARAEAAAGEFDLLLSDIELPDGTGLELMRELAQPRRGGDRHERVSARTTTSGRAGRPASRST